MQSFSQTFEHDIWTMLYIDYFRLETLYNGVVVIGVYFCLFFDCLFFIRIRHQHIIILNREA